MRYFPLCVDTRGKKLLVLGGGPAALSKIKSFLESEMEIFVLSRDFAEGLTALAKRYPDRLHLQKRQLGPDFTCSGYDYLLLASSDPALNQVWESWAKSHSLPCLRMDDAQNSDYLLTKRVDNGPIHLSLSIEGKNPSVGRLLGQELQTFIDGYDPEKIRLLTRLRSALVQKGRDNISEIMAALWEKDTAAVRACLEDINED